MGTTHFLVGTVTMLAASRVGAEPIAIREAPHHVTEAEVTVDATPSEIYAVVTDYAHWTSFLSDVRSATLERGNRETARLRFRSKLFKYEVTVQFDNQPGRMIRFTGVAGPPGGRAGGSYLLMPVDGGRRTRVVASLYLDVVGVPSLFVSGSKIRNMREAKLKTDMSDVMQLLQRRHAAALPAT